MRTVYLKNFRKGFATNSSSTHSVIYRNKEDLFKDLDIFELNYYDRFDNTIAASKEAKIKYVAANIMWHDKLYEIMSLYYPQMNEYKELIKKPKIKKHYMVMMKSLECVQGVDCISVIVNTWRQVFK